MHETGVAAVVATVCCLLPRAAAARLQEIKAGDFVTFPAGMDCVWDVKEAIHKHYNFH